MVIVPRVTTIGGISNFQTNSPLKIPISVPSATATSMITNTGIVGATVVTMGILSLPLMIKWNYNKKVSAGVICASGTLGQIIPPSIVLVLLATILQGANEEAAMLKGDLAPDPVTAIDLFAGALLPGLMLVVMFIIFIYPLNYLT